MRDGLPNASLVVYSYVTYGLSNRSHVQENSGNFQTSKLPHDGLVEFGRHNRHSVHAALNQTLYTLLHPMWIVIGRGNHDFVAVADRHLFEPLNDFGKEGIGDIGDDDSKQVAAARN